MRSIGISWVKIWNQAWAQALLGGAFVGYSVAQQPLLLVLVFLLLVAVWLGQFCFTQRKLVLQIAVIWIFIQYFFTRTIKVLPQPAVWGDEACLFGLLLGSILASFLNGSAIMQRVPAGRPLLAFMAIGIISGWINQLPFNNVLLGLRGMVQPALFYVVFINTPFDEKLFRRIMKSMQALVLIQCPLVMYQVATFHEGLDYAIEDAGFGTFGFGTANMLGWLILTFVFHFGFFAKAGQMTGRQTTAVFFFMIVTWFLNSARVTILLSGPLFAFVMMKGKLPKWKKGLFLGCSIIGGGMVLMLAAMIFGDELFPTSKEGVEELWEAQATDKSGGGRIFYLLDTQEMAHRHAPFPYIGMGPGGYSSYAGFTLKAPLLKKRLGHDIDKPTTGFAPDLIAVSGEYGLIGLAVWYWVLITIYRRNEENLKYIEDPYWFSIAKTMQVMCVIMFLAPAFSSVWQCQFLSGTYFILAGMTERYRKHIAETQACAPAQ